MELQVQKLKNLSVFNTTTPPSTGRPGGRSDAGGRGRDAPFSASESKPLLASVPVQESIPILQDSF
jgi:hypothetical protein